MPDYNVTVDLTVSVAIEAPSEEDLPAKVTDAITAALVKHTDFSRVRIHPRSRIVRITSNGEDLPTSANGEAKNGGVSGELSAEDLQARPAQGGLYQVSTKDGDVICAAPSDHPDWLQAIAQAVNAGRRVAD